MTENKITIEENTSGAVALNIGFDIFRIAQKAIEHDHERIDDAMRCCFVIDSTLASVFLANFLDWAINDSKDAREQVARVIELDPIQATLKDLQNERENND